MEEDADDLDNLFDGNESDNPQPQENTNNENGQNEGSVPEKVPVPKRVVKHPRLKFNPERLCGKRGIPILVDHFKDVKFKGKGHEKEDLKKLLTTLELWTHRLFPSMKFEGCLRQIEHLGKKRPVKTCLQKIRLDFPILAEDFVHDEEEQEQPDELEPEPQAQDAFDRLFDDYEERFQPVPSSIPSSSQTTGNVLGTSFGSSFSEEQKKRMEYNKMLAIERRKAKLSAMQTGNLLNSTDTENSTNVESILSSSLTERRVKDNSGSNFLFDYLQETFTNNESSSVGVKTTGESSQSVQLKDRNKSKINEVKESVDDGDKDETSANSLSNVRNNDYPEGKDNEELGLDELMDLVDEDDRDQINRDTLSSVKNNDEDNKDENDNVTLSNIRNNDCPEGGKKEELGLDELMDLVDEADRDQTNDTCVKNNNEGDKNETDFDTLSGNRNNDCSEDNDKEELDEVMDLVDEDHQHKTGDVLSVNDAISSSSKEEHLDS